MVYGLVLHVPTSFSYGFYSHTLYYSTPWNIPNKIKDSQPYPPLPGNDPQRTERLRVDTPRFARPEFEMPKDLEPLDEFELGGLTRSHTGITLASHSPHGREIEMDPNETLRLLAKALLEEDRDAAREFHSYLTCWLRRGGFEPAWTHLSKRQFNAFDPATGMLSK